MENSTEKGASGRSVSPTRLGLFGGTFDPIHHGHLIQARDALEQMRLERVIFIPAAISPHKLLRQTASAEARVAMLQAAISGEERFEISEIELQRQGPSYAVDTAEAFQKQYPNTELFYLIGQDNLAELHTWRQVEKLQTLVKFVVLPRGLVQNYSLPAISTRCFDISATEIRRRVANSQSIQYLVPEGVRAIIGRLNIYKELQP
jgi:nicotinate-nucleotide adenylyltransferase